MNGNMISLRWGWSNVFELNNAGMVSASVSTGMSGKSMKLLWWLWSFFELNHVWIHAASVWRRMKVKTIGLGWWSSIFFELNYREIVSADVSTRMNEKTVVVRWRWSSFFEFNHTGIGSATVLTRMNGRQLELDEDHRIFSNWIILRFVLQVCQRYWIEEKFVIRRVGRSLLMKIFCVVHIVGRFWGNVIGGGHDISEAFFGEFFDCFQLVSICFFDRMNLMWEFAWQYVVVGRVIVWVSVCLVQRGLDCKVGILVSVWHGDGTFFRWVESNKYVGTNDLLHVLFDEFGVIE